MKMKATIPVSSNMSMQSLRDQIGKQVPMTDMTALVGNKIGTAMVTGVNQVEGVPILEVEIDMEQLPHFFSDNSIKRGSVGFLTDGEDEL